MIKRQTHNLCPEAAGQHRHINYPEALRQTLIRGLVLGGARRDGSIMNAET